MDDIRQTEIINSLLNFGKKHKKLKHLVIICIFVEIAYFHLLRKMSKNIWRISSFAFLVCVFAIFGSFSLLEKDSELNTIYAISVSNNENIENYQAVYASNENNDILEEKFIEDYEVDSTEDFESVSDNDMFLADELLNGYAVKNTNSSSSSEIRLENFNSEDWNLILINKQHSIPEDYEFNLGVIRGSMKCDERIIESLLTMLSAAKDDGINLAVCSPYRDYNKQTTLFERKINRYMKMGYSYAESYKMTTQAVTVPGASEHEIGLALDIISDDYTTLNEGFADTAAGKWLYENSKYYGFILRYPFGKEDITGIEYEPWHFRYVGNDAAMYIMENNLCLEEFISLIE